MTIFGKIAKLSPLPVTARHIGFSADSVVAAVGRGRVLAASFVNL